MDPDEFVSCLQYLGFQLPEEEYEKQYAIADEVRLLQAGGVHGYTLLRACRVLV